VRTMPEYRTDAVTTIPEMTAWLASDIQTDSENVLTWVLAVMTKNPDNPDGPYGYAVVRLSDPCNMAANSILASAIINATLEHRDRHHGQED
jgi:hypothetical protein